MDPDLQNLGTMLSYCRPAGSKTERAFIRDFIAPIAPQMDRAGNLYKKIGDTPIVWSSHLDTVHHMGGKQEPVLYKDNVIGLKKGSKSNCLGADDTAGVWIMLEMIKAQKPGLYVFHRGEERGGVGSSHIAKREPHRLKGMKAAIAFDRRGTTSVITHQGWERCCSAAFAVSMAAMLPEYELDDGGSFTDTANYTDLIGECSNLSVGYYQEHSSNEMLDVSHLFLLRKSLLDLNLEKLVFERKPGETEYKNWRRYRYDDFDTYKINGSTAVTTTGSSYGSAAAGDYYKPWKGWEETYKDDQQPEYRTPKHTSIRTSGNMVQFVKNNPDAIADWLEQMGYDVSTMAEEIWGSVFEKNG